MMKKILLGLIIFLFGAVSPTQAAEYIIDSFHSQIEIEKDTSLTITETIKANFFEEKHGIFRFVPIIYSARGKTIKTGFQVISVNQPYEISRFNQSYKIQIGSADKVLTGPQTYVIKYKINDVLQRFTEYDELYWNVTGHEWDAAITTASAEVISPYAPIIKRQDFTDGELTIAVALDKNSQLIWPNQLEKTVKTIKDNWGYPVALLPLVIMLYFWLKKGRDKRYLTDNLYVKGKTTKTVSLFEHKFLPSVYSPIDNITAGEAGAITDQKVDTKDVVAEILELGRLGFLTLKRTEQKKWLGRNIDYVFTKLTKDQENLRDYQTYLLEKLFDNKNEVKLSELKNKFYLYLKEFRKKLYEHLGKIKIFDGNPQTVTTKWLGFSFALMTGGFVGVINFSALTNNAGPLGILALTIIPIIILIKNMPARTAWGYSLMRQIAGLKWFLQKGKWREEISEKRLFLGEMLPLAVALGTVDKLAKDMKDLGLQPPSYVQGFAAANFNSEFNRFTRQSTNNIVSAPSGTKWSGSSSWSGGSGFSSGGHSGGGFGGGGGGSW